MKHAIAYIFILFLLAASSLSSPAVAATIATPAATTQPKADQPVAGKAASPSGKLDDLKERLATKVAQLRQTQRKAIAGTVKEVSLVSVTIETSTKDVKIELTDDLKVFQILKGKRTALTTSDLEKGDFLVAFGEYDTTLDLLKAKILFIQAPLPKRIHGTVASVDSKNFAFTLTAADGQTYTVDVEKETKTSTWTLSGGIAKAGFSKLAVGDTVFVAGTLVPKKENRLSADRVLDVGNLSGAAPTPTPTLVPTQSASASATATSSAAKTTPKVTPKVTPKPPAPTPTP